MTGIFRLLYRHKLYRLLVVAIQHGCVYDQEWLLGLCLLKELRTADKVWNTDIMQALVAANVAPLDVSVHQQILEARYNVSQKQLKGRKLRDMESQYAHPIAAYRGLFGAAYNDRG